MLLVLCECLQDLLARVDAKKQIQVPLLSLKHVRIVKNANSIQKQIRSDHRHGIQAEINGRKSTAIKHAAT